MTRTEERLDDLFAAVRRQVQAPPMEPIDELPRSPLWSRRLAVVAAAVLVVVAAAVAIGRSDDDTIDTAGERIEPAAFDAAVAPLCEQFFRRAPGPQFPTREAYIDAFTDRIDVTYQFLAGLRKVGLPEDDPELPDRVRERLLMVVTTLRTLRSGLESSSAPLTQGDAAGAQRVWSTVDPELDRIVAELADHGAEACRP